MAEIDEVYRSKEAKDQAARAALAHKLFDEAQKQSGNTDEQFALLRRAGELAGDAGDFGLVVEAVDAIAAGFEIPPLRVKARLLKRALEQEFAASSFRARATPASDSPKRPRPRTRPMTPSTCLRRREGAGRIGAGSTEG